jgi:hypothetical protein
MRLSLTSLIGSTTITVHFGKQILSQEAGELRIMPRIALINHVKTLAMLADAVRSSEEKEDKKEENDNEYRESQLVADWL